MNPPPWIPAFGEDDNARTYAVIPLVRSLRRDDAPDDARRPSVPPEDEERRADYTQRRPQIVQLERLIHVEVSEWHEHT